MHHQDMDWAAGLPSNLEPSVEVGAAGGSPEKRRNPRAQLMGFRHLPGAQGRQNRRERGARCLRLNLEDSREPNDSVYLLRCARRQP